MTIKTFINRLNQANEQLVPAMLDVGKTVMLNRKADIQQRIQESGLDADGKPLPPYTIEYQQFKTDVGRYRGHVDLTLGNYSKNKRIKAVLKRRRESRKLYDLKAQLTSETLLRRHTRVTRKRLPSLKQVIENQKIAAKKRQLTGETLHRKKKNSVVGGPLWGNIHLVHEEATATRIQVKIGPTDEANKLKAEGLAIKRGNFLRLSEQEKQNSFKDIEAGFEDFLQNKIGK